MCQRELDSLNPASIESNDSKEMKELKPATASQIILIYIYIYIRCDNDDD